MDLHKVVDQDQCQYPAQVDIETQFLVQEKRDDGTVSVDLQGRFQNVTLAKRNDDGTVSAACVDTPEAAGAFLNSREKTTTITGTGLNGKAASNR